MNSQRELFAVVQYMEDGVIEVVPTSYIKNFRGFNFDKYTVYWVKHKVTISRGPNSSESSTDEEDTYKAIILNISESNEDAEKFRLEYLKSNKQLPKPVIRYYHPRKLGVEQEKTEFAETSVKRQKQERKTADKICATSKMRTFSAILKEKEERQKATKCRRRISDDSDLSDDGLDGNLHNKQMCEVSSQCELCKVAELNEPAPDCSKNSDVGANDNDYDADDVLQLIGTTFEEADLELNSRPQSELAGMENRPILEEINKNMPSYEPGCSEPLWTVKNGKVHWGWGHWVRKCASDAVLGQVKLKRVAGDATKALLGKEAKLYNFTGLKSANADENSANKKPFPDSVKKAVEAVMLKWCEVTQATEEVVHAIKFCTPSQGYKAAMTQVGITQAKSEKPGFSEKKRQQRLIKRAAGGLLMD